MYLSTRTHATDGPLPVSVIPAESPFASIDFSDDVDLRLKSLADCDRLILAAATAKRMLEMGGRPHGYEAGAGMTGTACVRCGRRGGDEVHAAPCGAVAPHSGVTCARPTGHDGVHESGHRPAIVWDQASIADDEAAAVLAASIEAQQYARQADQPVTVTDDDACPARHPQDGAPCIVKGPHDEHAYVPFTFGALGPRITWTDAGTTHPDDPDGHAARASLRIAGGAS